MVSNRLALLVVVIVAVASLTTAVTIFDLVGSIFAFCFCDIAHSPCMFSPLNRFNVYIILLQHYFSFRHYSTSHLTSRLLSLCPQYELSAYIFSMDFCVTLRYKCRRQQNIYQLLSNIGTFTILFNYFFLFTYFIFAQPCISINRRCQLIFKSCIYKIVLKKFLRCSVFTFEIKVSLGKLLQFCTSNNRNANLL